MNENWTKGYKPFARDSKEINDSPNSSIPRGKKPAKNFIKKNMKIPSPKQKFAENRHHAKPKSPPKRDPRLDQIDKAKFDTEELSFSDELVIFLWLK